MFAITINAAIISLMMSLKTRMVNQILIILRFTDPGCEGVRLGSGCGGSPNQNMRGDGLSMIKSFVLIGVINFL